MTYLYRYECKGIQPWILAGGKLRDVVAASNLIEQVPAERAKLCKGLGCSPKVLAEAAGGGTLEFADREELARFCTEWPMHMDEFAPGLHVVQAWVAQQRDGLDLVELRKRLGRARQQLHPELPQAGPLVEIAGRTGLPAVEIRDLVKDTVLLDRSGAAKATELSKARHLLARKFSDRQLAEEDEDLGSGMIAVVHADGNRIGEWIQANDLNSERFKAFSGALTDANAAAVQRATEQLNKEMAKAGHDNKPLPLRPVLLGGDDVTAIIAGNAAVPWTVAYLQAFATETQQRLQKAGFDSARGFTACAGIAWCKPHWPFHQALEVAESLCKAAKAGLRSDGRTHSGLLWHRILGSTETEWSELRRLEYGNGRLVGGPWRLDDLSKLAELADAVGNRAIPRGALRRWIDLESLADKTADELWNRTTEVQRQKPRHEAIEWTRFLDQLTALGVDHLTGRRPSEDGQSTTPLLDALTWARLQPGKGKLWPATEPTEAP